MQIIFLFLVTAFVGLGTHQGILLSNELKQVAGSVRLQASDVEWKTWNISRAAWSSGMQNYAESIQALRISEQVAASAIAPLPQKRLPEGLFSQAQVDLTSGVVEDLVRAKAAPTFETEAGPEVELAADRPVQVAPVIEPVPAAALPAPSVARPVPLLTTSPKYPWRALTKGIEGFVELAFSLDDKGNVIDINVVDSLPAGIFEKTATRALKKWKFADAGKAGNPQRWVQKFDFTLQQQELERAEPVARNCVSAGHRACTRIPANAVVVYVNPPQETETLSRVN